MNVYHGTSKQKFEQILKDRKIKKNNRKRIRRHKGRLCVFSN